MLCQNCPFKIYPLRQKRCAGECFCVLWSRRAEKTLGCRVSPAPKVQISMNSRVDVNAGRFPVGSKVSKLLLAWRAGAVARLRSGSAAARGARRCDTAQVDGAACGYVARSRPSVPPTPCIEAALPGTAVRASVITWTGTLARICVECWHICLIQ